MSAQPQPEPRRAARLADLAFALLAPEVGPAEASAEAAWLQAKTAAAGEAGPAAAWRLWCEAPPESDRALHGLCAMLAMGHTESLALALAAEVELEPMAGRVLAWLQAPVAGSRPSMGLLATLAGRIDGAAPARHFSALLAGRARECGLLQPEVDNRSLPETPLRLPAPVALALRGQASRWPGVETGLADAPPLPPSVQAEARRYAHAFSAGGSTLAIRSGHPREARAAAQAIAQALDGEPAFFDGEPAPGLGPWLWLTGHLPVYCQELAPGERRRLPRLPGFPGPLLVATGPDGGFEREGEPVTHWSLPVPPPAERTALWQLATGDSGLAESLGSRSRHGAARIHSLARAGRFEAALAGQPRVDAEHILRAGRCGAAADLGALAELLPEAIEDAALVLPPSLRAELESLLNRCLARDSLATGLGPAMRARYRPGVRALLYGPSGTGKTLAVGWLATRIGLPLYRVDLASVTSKYIGETEKNLAQLFARAEHAEVVLMFDEADALFGKRTEVKDSNDRFANAQTNYLLQRIETFEGIAILASNSRARFDSAFTRRLDTIVEFPLPAPEERRALWLAHLGEGHALSAAELNRLAANCELAGGHIRNSVLAAAANARGARRAVAFDDLVGALAAEYRKLGKPAPHGLGSARP